MQFRVSCSCGEVADVGAADAGKEIPCRCGRIVVVPPLPELRRQAEAQNTGRSPEAVIEALLVAGRLPMEHHCVLCGIATEHILSCRTVCEIAYVEQPGSSGPAFFARLLLGRLGEVIAECLQSEEKQRGKDRIYPLPLRVCDSCVQQLSNDQAVWNALYRVPLYRRLLDKYPRARVSHIARSPARLGPGWHAVPEAIRIGSSRTRLFACSALAGQGGCRRPC
jgi:hypothetical protein